MDSNVKAVGRLQIAPKTTLVDLGYRGYSKVIAATVLETSAGAVIVDPGPDVSWRVLKAALGGLGYGVADIAAILLTHIHLDHAGGTGTIVREAPHLPVFVHSRGAPHLQDPTRLLSSAAQLYGDQMDSLWGRVLSVPADNIRSLEGGEQLDFGQRSLDVEYTPGHAWHHVSYFDHSTSIAFVGDTAGIRVMGFDIVIPASPPPDINLEAWQSSISLIRERQPEALFLTHFGLAAPIESHLDQLWDCLMRWSERVQRLLEAEGEDRDRAAAFLDSISEELRENLPAVEQDHYKVGAGVEYSWLGLARYWRKKGS